MVCSCVLGTEHHEEAVRTESMFDDTTASAMVESVKRGSQTDLTGQYQPEHPHAAAADRFTQLLPSQRSWEAGTSAPCLQNKVLGL